VGVAEDKVVRESAAESIGLVGVEVSLLDEDYLVRPGEKVEVFDDAAEPRCIILGDTIDVPGDQFQIRKINHKDCLFSWFVAGFLVHLW
jgi:hypothetical protein